MKRKMIGFLICSLLITTILPIEVSSDEPLNNIIYVDDDNIEGPWDGTQEHPYRFIDYAIDAANDGDTIYVYSGTYYENLLIEKSICLEGENKETTIIDGSSWKTVVNISCDNVTVKRFSIMHGTSGIRVWKSNNITITENIIKYITGTGLYLGESTGISITHNIITKNGNLDPKVISLTIGISLIRSSNINISGNLVSVNANWGFIIINLNNSIISRNSITYNYGPGIDLYDSFDNRIVENNFIENGQKTGVLWWGDLGDNAMFLYSMFPKKPYNNIWDKNFWDKGRILPKLVFGVYRFSPRGIFEFPWIDFDWNPAKEPYDIPIVEEAL